MLALFIQVLQVVYQKKLTWIFVEMEENLIEVI